MSRDIFVTTDQFKQVKLASGGVLAVVFRGNLMALSERDLAFVLAMVKQLESYQPTANEQAVREDGGGDGEQFKEV